MREKYKKLKISFLGKLFKLSATHRCTYSEKPDCCSYFEKSCRLGLVGHCRIGRSLLRSA